MCSYPAGPYDFDDGITVPAMSWPAAVAMETGSPEPSFEEFHCDEEVRSIFVYVGNTT